MIRKQRSVGAVLVLLFLWSAAPVWGRPPGPNVLLRPAGGGGPPPTEVKALDQGAFACAWDQPAGGCPNTAWIGEQIYRGGSARTDSTGSMRLESPTMVFQLRQNVQLNFFFDVNFALRALLFAGRVFISHDPQGRPVRMIANDTVWDAVDTQFVLDVQAGGVYGAVMKDGGSIKVTLHSGTSLELKSMQQIFIPNGAQSFPPVQSLDPQEQRDWAQILAEWSQAPGIPPWALGKPTSRYFPETGHTVSGKFFEYWNAHGGVAQQGYPQTEEDISAGVRGGKYFDLQYFERAVFEFHPENAGTPYEVELALLGTARYQSKYGTAGARGQVANGVNPRTFPETGKTLGGKFRVYWETHGGLMQQGLPISNEFTEVSDSDGKSYRVQYFERAVLEYHPENAGTPYEVLLAPLGTYLLQGK